MIIVKTISPEVVQIRGALYISTWVSKSTPKTVLLAEPMFEYEIDVNSEYLPVKETLLFHGAIIGVAYVISTRTRR